MSQKIVIQEGYGSSPLEIRFQAMGGRETQLWIEFSTTPKKETLTYVSINELLDLRKAINNIIREVIERDGRE